MEIVAWIRKNIEILLIGFLLLAVIFLGWMIVAQKSDTLRVAFLNVGQGDAIFIEHRGVQILVDGGRGGNVLSTLGDVMPFWDRSIDMLIATHPDADHIGGFPEVLDRFDVEYVIESGNVSDTGVYEAFANAIVKEGCEHTIARAGYIIQLSNSAYIEFLFPDRMLEEVAKWEANTSSLIARVVHGENTFLLTGDAPASVETYLAGLYGDRADSDVLKAGHHGSDTSSATVFLAATTPETVVVSAGCDNRYGHPDKEVIDRIEALGAELLGTCEEGAIVFESDGESIVRIE
ncbi:MAG: MBL fold metallo-hydrolase [Parcubacteria group bacterium]|nr:MBL fold metallo-hydrolase [Parcubacteria group bacterium]